MIADCVPAATIPVGIKNRGCIINLSGDKGFFGRSTTAIILTPCREDGQNGAYPLCGAITKLSQCNYYDLEGQKYRIISDLKDFRKYVRQSREGLHFLVIKTVYPGRMLYL
jgi:hypothetical protein